MTIITTTDDPLSQNNGGYVGVIHNLIKGCRKKLDWLLRRINKLVHPVSVKPEQYVRYTPHFSVILIALFVFLGNNISSSQEAEYISSVVLATAQAEEIDALVENVAPLTYGTEEDAENLILTYANNTDFFQKPTLTTTETTTEIVQKPAYTDRSSVITYTVQNGDTASEIADTFNLKVASIKYFNELTNIDRLKPGDQLKIPVTDLTDSQIATAKQKAYQKTQVASRYTGTSSNYTSGKETASSGYEKVSGQSFVTPIRHNGISRGLQRGHYGIDYRANVGTPVASAADGKVIAKTTGWGGGYGLSIVVDHGGGRTTRYAHLSSFAADIGQSVGQGQIIGYSGNTGRSTGPHLHFQYELYGRPQNPF